MDADLFQSWCVKRMSIRVLCLLASFWLLLPAWGQPIMRRLGIVPLSQGMDALSDLLMVELSKQPGIQMLERG